MLNLDHPLIAIRMGPLEGGEYYELAQVDTS